MTLTCISFFRCRVPYLQVHVLLMSYYITKLDLRLGILRLLGGLIFTSWSARSARTAGPKIALRFPCLCVCLFACPHLSRIPYSRKIWQELNLAKWPRTAKIKYWRNLNLAIAYGEGYDVILN